MRASPSPDLDLVLVGGGHAHVQVLRSLMMRPLPRARVTVVLDRPVAVYSGMVPGFVAGDYRRHELAIDVVPLARRAGARVVLSAATSVDPEARVVHLADRPPLPWDLCSMNVGSTVRGLGLPGIQHALPTRPIGRFTQLLDDRLEARRVVIVGAGAGGVELAFTLQARLRAAGRSPQVTVVDSGDGLLPGASPRTRALVTRKAAERGITVLSGVRAARIEADAVILDDGRSLPCDLPVWVTGAAPLPVVDASPLPKDARGWVRVGPTLQVEGHDGLFAVGDCAAPTHAPWVPKAGVYAVREGPVLTRNLRALVEAGPGTTPRLERYEPQRDFLSLLHLGDGEAVGSKWGFAVSGRWVLRWKDRIDRRFMERFQVLGPEGAATAAFPPMESDEPMECGGCAAKVGQASLEAALASLPAAAADPSVVLGLADADDAAAVRTPAGETLVTTVDAFEAFTDDPFLVGKVAAVNAVSDLLAKGIDPTHALATVGVPDGRPQQVERALRQAMLGVRAALDSLGCTLLGGHTTRSAALTVGLTVTGFGEHLLRASDARPGDRLVLTKPLGTGVLFFADMQGLCPGPHLAAALESMQRDNRFASLTARSHATASTDISGFGLAGHLGEVLRASGLVASLEGDALPVFDGVLAFLERGLRSTFHPSNESANGPRVHGEHPLRPLLFDPQTSGGLLLCVPEASLEAAVAELEAERVPAHVIGTLRAPAPGEQPGRIDLR